MNPAPSQQVLADAAEWFALLRSGEVSEADVRRWRHWLAASPEHHRGWQMVERVEQQFNAACGGDPDQAEATLTRTRQRRLDRRGMLKGMALLFGAGGLGWAGWRASPLPTVVAAWGASHRTGTGEIRELALPDGSRLWLNTNTAINTAFNADSRRINLITGEILLATAPDHRPLIVATAQGQARPLGTRFTVRCNDGTTLVAVYQGKVAVTNGRQGTRIVPAGRQTRFSGAAIEPPETADPAREAWHRGGAGRRRHSPGRSHRRTQPLPARLYQCGAGSGRTACVRRLLPDPAVAHPFPAGKSAAHPGVPAPAVVD